MNKLDPIIAVKDIEASSKWYQAIFGCRSMHGANKFDILVMQNDEVFICLHKWEEHGHPTMKDSRITPGNGLILYFRTDDINQIREKAKMNNVTVEEEMHLNSNSTKMEFSIRDPDGYYWTITEFHEYKG